MRFLRRLIIVAAVTAAIVAIGWRLKDTEAVSNYLRDDRSGTQLIGSSQPRWPSLNFNDSSNTLVMVPIIGSVIFIDRRRRRRSTRIPPGLSHTTT